jgi:hypothetical protein
LAQRVLDVRPSVADHLPVRSPVLIIGLPATIDGWLAAQGLPARPFVQSGTAQVWAGRDAKNRSYVVISAHDANALTALQRGLPHYGKQSWLIFEGARAADKGVWPPHGESP